MREQDRLYKDLSSLRLQRENSAINKLITLFFKLWFVWASIWMIAMVSFGYVVFHFVAKHW